MSVAMLAATGCVFFASESLAVVTGDAGYDALEYYANPHSGEAFISFDWFGDDLYYSTGSQSYGKALDVYKYDGNSALSIYTSSDVYGGSKVKAIGDYVYFNDGGTDSRWTFDYFKYDPAAGGTPVKVVDSATTGDDIWGLQTRTGSDIWAAGGWTTVIRYSTLDGNGDLVSQPMTDLGTIGDSSGPLGFDGQGNLYYAQGYTGGDWNVFKWTAAEVSAAVGDPLASALDPTGHIFATLNVGSGATGLAFDDLDNLYVTATSYGLPSSLLQVSEGANSYVELASSDGRMSELRFRSGTLYVSDGDGVYQVSAVPEPGTFVLLFSALAVGLVAGGKTLRRKRG